MSDAARHRLIKLGVLAALAFVVLPHMAVLRPATGTEAGHTLVWPVSPCTSLPLAVRRLWPTPVFACVLLAACTGLTLVLCPHFEDAAGRRERLSTVAAAPADRGDLSAALIRPDGIVARAAAPGLPADTAAPVTALRTWLGEQHTRTPNGQQGEPGRPAGRKGTGQRRGEV
ncbi:hypothetical protein OHA84_34975 [Streptomyces sp. NBC_00513]|uniref:aromatic-ring hydroxylase C-terminal domain-containing protein n=1 Tax=unclassified Streptomyces TaxID=2593676 RepID=UPI0022556BDA|nr:hypothetical protein [Streptomyces sp. NBC_00424]MCX5071275.1 hypothetical protein [Streptomyces sp. NBC_00424]WUD45309.1 hypothetical protein OHA84_34975 [Streptomyces sp. NBC_00513]